MKVRSDVNAHVVTLDSSAHDQQTALPAPAPVRTQALPEVAAASKPVASAAKPVQAESAKPAQSKPVVS